MIDSAIVGFCMHCGKFLRESEQQWTPSSRLICSAQCGERLLLQEQALDQLRNKSTNSIKYSGYFCNASGTAFLLFGMPHLFLPHPLFWLGIFLVTLGVIFLLSGYFFLRIAKKK